MTLQTIQNPAMLWNIYNIKLQNILIRAYYIYYYLNDSYCSSKLSLCTRLLTMYSTHICDSVSSLQDLIYIPLKYCTKPHTCITNTPWEIWSYKPFLASGYSFQFWVPRASSTGSTTSKTHLMKKSGDLSDMCPCALMACQHQRPALIFCNAGSD